MDDSDWVRAYVYLLDKLRTVANADSSLILDIESSALIRIEEDISEDNENIKLSKESREDLDPIRLRAPTPREAFKAAIGVLRTRLLEVPALADRVIEKFERDPSNIQWRPDTSERNQLSEQSYFSVSDFQLRDTKEVAKIETILRSIENLL